MNKTEIISTTAQQNAQIPISTCPTRAAAPRSAAAAATGELERWPAAPAGPAVPRALAPTSRTLCRRKKFSIFVINLFFCYYFLG